MRNETIGCKYFFNDKNNIYIYIILKLFIIMYLMENKYSAFFIADYFYSLYL